MVMAKKKKKCAFTQSLIRRRQTVWTVLWVAKTHNVSFVVFSPVVDTENNMSGLVK